MIISTNIEEYLVNDRYNILQLKFHVLVQGFEHLGGGELNTVLHVQETLKFHVNNKI